MDTSINIKHKSYFCSMEFRSRGMDSLPPVVKNLLIINGLFFLATKMLPNLQIDLYSIFGLYYWESPNFKVWQFVTHMFMHGNTMHLFSNMFSLWMFGTIIENFLGSKRFLIFYIVCGLGASLLHLGVISYEFHVLKSAIAAFDHNPTYKEFASLLTQNSINNPGFLKFKADWANNPMSSDFSNAASVGLHQWYNSLINEPTVGASGAVFGILFAFGYLFPNTELMLLFIPFPIKAKYLVGLYALFELYAGISNAADDNIAHFAHLGGMLFAFIILKIWNKNNRTHFY